MMYDRPILFELGGHLFSEAVNQTGHRFLSVATCRRFQLVIESLHDTLLVGQSLLQVVDALFVNIGVKSHLRQQLRLAILRIQTQSTLTVTPTHTLTQKNHSRYAYRMPQNYTTLPTHVDVERHLRLWLRLAVLRIQTQSTPTVTPVQYTVPQK